MHVEKWNDSNFYRKIHFHEEYQLTHILKGRGKLLIGADSVDFASGDSFLLGKNLPHVFKLGPDGRKGSTRCVSVFFDGEVIGGMLADMPQAVAIRDLMAQADVGLRLDEGLAYEISSTVKKLTAPHSFGRLLDFLGLLSQIARASGNQAVNNANRADIGYDEHGVKLLNEIFRFIQEHHLGRITLADVAMEFGMNPSAFCRFFKSRTHKTFSQFLIELRVAKACELMRQGALNATETCFTSGFTNLSNFHRQFKSIIGMTPTQYRQRVGGF